MRAIQGGIAKGDVKDILVLDATPLSLGVETMGNVMTVLIARNTTIPTSKSETFSTAADNQNAVTINVLQGERPMSKDNRLLGTFNLEGIAPAPRGTPQIEVTFNIDVNGILAVTAKDKGTNKEAKVTIQNSGGLSKEEVEKMKREAESHADEDKKRREAIDAKNRGESVAYQAERDLKEHGDKVTPEVRTDIERAINELKDSLKGDDGDIIKAKTEAVMTVSQKLGEAIYKSQAEAAGATGAGAAGAATDAPRGPDRPPRRGRRGQEGRRRDRRGVRSQRVIREPSRAEARPFPTRRPAGECRRAFVSCDLGRTERVRYRGLSLHAATGRTAVFSQNRSIERTTFTYSSNASGLRTKQFAFSS